MVEGEHGPRVDGPGRLVKGTTPPNDGPGAPARAGQGPHARLRPVNSPLAGKRLLVLSEDAELAVVLASAAAELGGEALRAASGQDALRSLEGSPPQVAVLDLPVADAGAAPLLEALVRRGIPAVVVSGVYRGPRASAELRRLGARDLPGEALPAGRAPGLARQRAGDRAPGRRRRRGRGHGLGPDPGSGHASGPVPGGGAGLHPARAGGAGPAAPRRGPDPRHPARRFPAPRRPARLRDRSAAAGGAARRPGHGRAHPHPRPGEEDCRGRARRAGVRRLERRQRALRGRVRAPWHPHRRAPGRAAQGRARAAHGRAPPGGGAAHPGAADSSS